MNALPYPLVPFPRGNSGQSYGMTPPDDTKDAVLDTAVASRAGGRPPEEAASDDPEEQARVILEESQDRTAAGRSATDAGA
jgi:hypothetical protein